MRRHLLALVFVVLLMAGCGSRSGGISEVASDDLRVRVESLRGATAAGDRAAAENLLAELRQRVAVLRSEGELSGSAARRILDAAAVVEVELAAMPTTTTTAPPPPTTQRSDDDDDDGGDGDRRGKGRGRKGDD